MILKKIICNGGFEWSSVAVKSVYFVTNSTYIVLNEVNKKTAFFCLKVLNRFLRTTMMRYSYWLRASDLDLHVFHKIFYACVLIRASSWEKRTLSVTCIPRLSWELKVLNNVFFTSLLFQHIYFMYAMHTIRCEK